MSEFNCVKCGGKLECFGGLSAHPDNWTCPKCDRAAMSNHITAFSHVTGVGPDRAAMSSDTPRTPVSVWVVCDGAGDCLFATNDEQNAKDHFQICVDEPSEFRTGPYTLTEYVPKRDLAARDAELATVTSVLESIKVALRRKGVSESYVDWAAYCRESVERAECAEAELADWKASGEKMAATFNEVVAERDSWKAKADALLVHLPDNWGDEVVEGELMLRVESDAIDAAREG